MEFTTNRKRITISAILTAVLLVLIVCNIPAFINQDSKQFQIGWFLLTVVVAGLFGAVTAFRIRFQEEKWEKRASILLLCCSPIVTFGIVEYVNNNVNIFFDFNLANFVMNLLWYYLVYGVIYALTNRIRVTIWISNTLFWLFAIVNYAVTLFRGEPILPWDFMSVGTALSVASNYTFVMTWNVLLATCLMLLWNMVASKLTYVNRSLKANIIGKVAIVSASIVFVTVFYQESTLPKLGLSVYTWRQAQSTHDHGIVLSLAMNTQFLMVDSPEDYSVQQVEAISNQIDTRDFYQVSETSMEQKPNIIAIMNESLADFRQVGDFQTNQELMPFLTNLTENTIKGNLYMSIHGSGTCNSEFEFLTGNSMAFLPSGCRPYQQYITDDTYSLVSTLNDQGYTSLAVHPYYAAGWNRDRVYPLLGFQDFVSMEDFENPEYIREYISDKSSYDKVIDLYEQKDPDERLFLFNVTMQNHGGYLDYSNGFQNTVEILNKPEGQEFPKAEQYLTLVQESDKAFEYLVNYFSQQEEPTIILMFGDHQPTLEDEFYDFLVGPFDQRTFEEQMRSFITPFYIWANYDIPEQTVEHMSANYLSNLLLDVAGLEKTEYNQFLDGIQEQLPVFTAIGYVDNQNNYYRLEDYKNDPVYASLIDSYDMMQYNYLFDPKNRLNSVFTISDQAG